MVDRSLHRVMARLEEHRKINCKLGEGIINVEALKKVADAQGTKAYIVERSTDIQEIFSLLWKKILSIFGNYNWKET